MFLVGPSIARLRSKVKMNDAKLSFAVTLRMCPDYFQYRTRCSSSGAGMSVVPRTSDFLVNYVCCSSPVVSVWSGLSLFAKIDGQNQRHPSSPFCSVPCSSDGFRHCRPDPTSSVYRLLGLPRFLVPAVRGAGRY